MRPGPKPILKARGCTRAFATGVKEGETFVTTPKHCIEIQHGRNNWVLYTENGQVVMFDTAAARNGKLATLHARYTPAPPRPPDRSNLHLTSRRLQRKIEKLLGFSIPPSPYEIGYWARKAGLPDPGGRHHKGWLNASILEGKKR